MNRYNNKSNGRSSRNDRRSSTSDHFSSRDQKSQNEVRDEGQSRRKRGRRRKYKKQVDFFSAEDEIMHRYTPSSSVSRSTRNGLNEREISMGWMQELKRKKWNLKDLAKCFEINFSKARLAKLAYKIEREICGISGGVQDFYAASYGGTNLFEFHGNRFKRTKITMPDLFRNEFESSLLVIFLGKSRNSSKIIDSQKESLLKSGKRYMDFMKETVDAVYKVKNTILTSNFEKFHHLINRLWKIKKKFSSEISNSEIDILYEKLRDLGVRSGKLSGAGGGGFMFMFTNFDKKRLLKDYLIKRNISIFNVYLTNDCAESHVYGRR